MTVELEQVRREVGASDADADLLERKLEQAVVYVEKYLADRLIEEDDEQPPDSIIDEAVIACASELFTQSKAPHGFLNQQFDGASGPESVAVRIGSDPLRPVYGILAPWVGPSIA